jgi:hypothetical protein
MNELQRIWKEVVVAYSSCCGGISLLGTEERRGKTSGDSNRAPVEYESTRLPQHDAVSVRLEHGLRTFDTVHVKFALRSVNTMNL